MLDTPMARVDRVRLDLKILYTRSDGFMSELYCGAVANEICSADFHCPPS